MIPYREMIYTGPIDEFFDYRFGKLPYRSLRLQVRDAQRRRRCQPVAVVNYPNDHPYTRVTEFKHLTGQEHPKTTLVYEYPQRRGRSLLPGPAAGERRALPAVPGAGRRRPPACTSSAGWRPTSTTTWTRSTAQALTLYAKLTGQSRREALANPA